MEHSTALNTIAVIVVFTLMILMAVIPDVLADRRKVAEAKAEARREAMLRHPSNYFRQEV